MKTFKQLVSEVAEPRGGDERRFKQMHVDAIEVVDYPIPGNDHVFKGTIQHPGRLADIQDPDSDHYDQTYKDHGDAGIISRFDDDEEDEEVDEEISKRVAKRRQQLAVDEETQLDELSRKTLGSYVKKASTDMYLKGQAVQYHTNKANDSKGSAFEKESKKKHMDAADKALRKASNRDTGISRATNRLTKEETIIEAVRPGTVKLGDGTIQKITKEDADLLNSLFTQLNSANRTKMESRLTSSKNGFAEILQFAKNV